MAQANVAAENRRTVMHGIKGCGLGLRGEFLEAFTHLQACPDWIEITPENWLKIPSYHQEYFEVILRRYPTVAHGVSLSIGSPEPLNLVFLERMKGFLDTYGIAHYSEHLSFSSIGGVQSYELLPLPMTNNMVTHIAHKVKEVQERLERPLILENASYYHVPYSEMREIDFVCEVLERSGAKLLLDVNNVFVNAANHRFDPDAYIAQIDPCKVAYIHVAGHLEYPQEVLLLDTHGEQVCSEVWALLERTLRTHPAPVMLERDNNIPALEVLMQEFARLRHHARGLS